MEFHRRVARFLYSNGIGQEAVYYKRPIFRWHRVFAGEIRDHTEGVRAGISPAAASQVVCFSRDLFYAAFQGSQNRLLAGLFSPTAIVGSVKLDQ